jgi:uncharacterized repeat protein (TIGR03847 family)
MSERDLGSPDRFTVGAIGPVGNRLFILQVWQAGTVLTVKVEKNQVALMASYLARIVRELGRPASLPEDLEVAFDEDDEPDWIVGTIGVSYDEESDRLIVAVEELTRPDDPDESDDPAADAAWSDEGGEGERARISITKEQAAAFAIRATRLVEAGRPPCPLCGLPLDPSGHDCPRTNGHRPPAA